MAGKFTEGRQPCNDFTPQREGNGYATWDNVHKCYGPFDDSNRPQCGGTVSFCENCVSDHHSHGWDKCPEQQESE